MPEGSSSAAPVMTPGPNDRHTRLSPDTFRWFDISFVLLLQILERGGLRDSIFVRCGDAH
jgi:hypothetical protein